MPAELLKERIEKLLAMLGIEGADVAVPPDAASLGRAVRRVVAIRAQDSKRLIGPRGEHLRALNTIARRLVETAYGEEAANFLVDVNDYHEERMEAVRANARMLAQRARLFKHDVEMSPMSPYERLVVHELFAEDPEIKTESHGEGKFRHIVLKYKDSALVSPN